MFVKIDHKLERLISEYVAVEEDYHSSNEDYHSSNEDYHSSNDEFLSDSMPEDCTTLTQETLEMLQKSILIGDLADSLEEAGNRVCDRVLKLATRAIKRKPNIATTALSHAFNHDVLSWEYLLDRLQFAAGVDCEKSIATGMRAQQFSSFYDRELKRIRSKYQSY